MNVSTLLLNKHDSFSNKHVPFPGLTRNLKVLKVKPFTSVLLADAATIGSGVVEAVVLVVGVVVRVVDCADVVVEELVDWVVGVVVAVVDVVGMVDGVEGNVVCVVAAVVVVCTVVIDVVVSTGRTEHNITIIYKLLKCCSIQLPYSIIVLR